MRFQNLDRVAVLTLALISTVAADLSMAQTAYQWRDEQGKLVVSDRPPRDLTIPYEEVEMGRSTAPARVWQAPGSEGAREAPMTLEPDGEIDNPPFKKNPEICAAAQRNIENLNTYPRIRMRTADGDMVILSEEQKQAQREEARRLVRLHCE